MGGDKKVYDPDTLEYRFNPRPRMGGDLFQVSEKQEVTRFNPRPRMGGDPRQRNWLLIQTKSPYLREPNGVTTRTRLRARRLRLIVKQIHQLAGCANLPAKKCLLGVRALSEHERPIGIVCRFNTDMLDS